MKSRGPKREPTSELQKRGSWRGDARAKTEPRLSKHGLTPPEWLPKPALPIFEMTAEQLQAADLDKSYFLITVAGLAYWLHRFITASAQLETESITLHGEKGGAYVNPTANATSNAWKHVANLTAELGMSPSTISKVAGDLRGEELDDFELWDLTTRAGARTPKAN
jgi:P27 family predicted phage terminase small subunit